MPLCEGSILFNVLERRPRKNQSSPPGVALPSKKHQPASSALSMLSTYSDSEDSDKYEIPSTIVNMFPENVPEENVSSDDEITGGQLGFFDLGSSSESVEGHTGSSRQKVSVATPTGSSVREVLVVTTTEPLSNYLCWKCSNVGHLPQDCTVSVTGTKSSKVKLSSELRSHYDQCRMIKKRKGDRCAECGIHSNLASCLECGWVWNTNRHLVIMLYCVGRFGLVFGSIL